MIPALTITSIRGRVLKSMRHAVNHGEAGQGLSNDPGQLCCGSGLTAGTLCRGGRVA
jgi:hypothetical protein